MREIKYQGWNGKQMLQVVRIHLDADGAIWWSNDFKQLKIYNAEHNPMRQYTGLKDKNGKEIYEGDIVIQDTGHVWSVAWSSEHGAFILKTNDPHNIKSPAWLDLEVIGNIYENPMSSGR